MILRILLWVVCFLAFASPAFAELNVVATLPWIGSLASDIGGDKVKVTTLVKANRDPHEVVAKPSMILQARRADILMFNGLELEGGFLSILVESSRNPKIQPGIAGNFDCSRFVEVIDQPVIIDRSMGDVHPLGNPYYHLSPRNISKVVEGITERLSRVDPPKADFYKMNLAAFQEKLREKQKQWSSYRLRGEKFLPYHKLFEYLAREFGFEIVGYLEPKPGIPPSAGHVEKIIEMTKRAKPKAILGTMYCEEEELRFLSQKTMVKYIIVPHDVGATAACKDWFTLMDQALAALE